MTKIPTTDLTVADVLEAPAEYQSVEVRTIGPALVLVMERDAPLRLGTLASTEREFEALRESVANDPRFRALLDVYFANEDLTRREVAHDDRLAAGTKFRSRLTD
jgi:hypothetical protein